MKTIIFVAITMAALGAVGITTAIMSSVTLAHAQKGLGGECHATGKGGVGAIGCTGPSGAQHVAKPPFPGPDTMCNNGQRVCHNTGPLPPK